MNSEIYRGMGQAYCCSMRPEQGARANRLRCDLAHRLDRLRSHLTGMQV